MRFSEGIMIKSYLKKILDDVIKVHSSIEERSYTMDLRKEMLEKSPNSLVKVAFDTRRVDQYNEFNPRRNLQYYHRSESFLDKESSDTIKTLFKLKTAIDTIKDEFCGDPDWFDSYCRILCSAVDKTLRIGQNDMDFSQSQLDYLKELLYLRYRLNSEDIERLSEKELSNIILNKDEKLLYKQIYSNYNNGGLKKDGGNESLSKDGRDSRAQTVQIIKDKDDLIEKLFGNIKASKDNKEVQRSITITVNDKIVEEVKKEG